MTDATEISDEERALTPELVSNLNSVAKATTSAFVNAAANRAATRLNAYRARRTRRQ